MRLRDVVVPGVCVLALVATGGSGASAQVAVPPAAQAPITIGGSTKPPPAAASPAPERETCIEVEIEGERSPNFQCLTERLRRSTQPSVAPSQVGAPVNAASPAPQVGTFSQSATQERMGANFGKSLSPERPPKQPFSFAPLGQGR